MLLHPSLDRIGEAFRPTSSLPTALSLYRKEKGQFKMKVVAKAIYRALERFYFSALKTTVARKNECIMQVVRQQH
jgi:hypothetical protein